AGDEAAHHVTVSDRRFGGDDRDVGGEGDGQTAGGGEPVDGRDHGLVERLDVRHQIVHAPHLTGDGGDVACGLCHVVEVAAWREPTTGAGDDSHACRGVLTDLTPHPRQLLEHGGVGCVC